MTAGTEVPKTQRALVITSWGAPLTLRDDFPVPEPKKGQLLVRVLYSGVCHSDVSISRGYLPGFRDLPLPLVAGHEATGVVAKVAPDVTDFKEGDHVGIMMTASSCMNCEHCKSANEQLCPSGRLIAAHWNGTFQEYTLVSALHAHRLPDGIDLDKAAPLHCAGVTVYRALKETEVRPGQIIAITGAAGGLGSFAIQFAKSMGMVVLALDVGEAKGEHCRKLGADFYVDVGVAGDVVAEVIKLTKGGPHGVLNVATVIKPLEDAIRYVRKHGTVVAVGLPKDSEFKLNSFFLISKMITLRGSFLGNRQDMDEAIDFFRRGVIKVPVEVHGLADVPQLLERLSKGQVNGRFVVDMSKL